MLQVSKPELFWSILISSTGRIKLSIIDSPEQNVYSLQEDLAVCTHCFIRHVKTKGQHKLHHFLPHSLSFEKKKKFKWNWQVQAQQFICMDFAVQPQILIELSSEKLHFLCSYGGYVPS